jgi:hypothetical protein
MKGAASPEAAPGKKTLPRDANRNPYARVPPVEQIVTVIDVDDINVVIVVPVIAPGFRPRVNHAEPEAVVLEAGISADNHKREVENAEPMVAAKVSTVAIVWNAIAVVTATLLPVAVVGIPTL